MQSSNAPGTRLRQRRIALTAIIGIALITVLGGCSSAPDQPDAVFEARNRASRYAEFGNQYFSQANYEMARNFYELALRENISVDHLSGIAKSHNSIGRVYSVTGNRAAAEREYALALEFALLAQDAEQEMQVWVNRGELAMREGEPQTARAALERAREIEASNSDITSAILYHNLGTLYAQDGDLATARTEIERARALNEADGDWIELASNYFMLASISSREGNHDAAYEHATQALNFDKRAEHSPGIAADLDALGRISERRGNDEAAYQYYLRSLRVYLAINDASGSTTVLGRLQSVAERTGREAEAREFALQQERIRNALEES